MYPIRLDAKQVADLMVERMKGELDHAVTLTSIQTIPDEGLKFYQHTIQKMADNFGLVTYHQVVVNNENEFVKEFFDDYHDDGIIFFTPMADYVMDYVNRSLNPQSDIDFVSRYSRGRMLEKTAMHYSCTAEAVIKLLTLNGFNIEGKIICILGRSETVGKPLELAFTNYGATVICCNSHTTSGNIYRAVRNSEYIISATGQAGIINECMIDCNQVLVGIGRDDITKGAYTLSRAYCDNIGQLTTAVLFDHLIHKNFLD